MLFLVIERFRNGDPEPVRKRFKQKGRMLPDNVHYIDSWITQDGTTCYQIMDATKASDLDPWIVKWKDLVDFEIIAVMSSEEFNRPNEP